MGVRDFFKKKPRFTLPKPTGKPTSGDGRPPKNGVLTLAVVASVAIMVALAVLNVRLIQDPSIAGKAFGPLVPAKPEREPVCAVNPLVCTSEPDSCYSPPEVTFYRNLVAQDERDPGKSRPACEPRSDRGPDSGLEKKKDAVATPKSPTRREDSGQGSGASAKTGAEASGLTGAGLPGPESGAKSYIVQVGAFTQPRIAQQWAAKWKSRGYDVLLKPVARPKSGVLYRLYLGKFPSQSEADALVKRLKAKEGISAFTLLVRQ